MRRHLLALVFVSAPLAAMLGAAQSGTSAVKMINSKSGLQLDALDRSVDACTDFYKFACGGWQANNPIPPDQSSWARFIELQERNNEILHRILDAAAAGRDPDAKQVGDYYSSCMDEPGINAKGVSPLEPDLRRIASLAARTDLPPLLAHLHAIGVNAFFTFGAAPDYKNANQMMAIAGQGGLGLPDRDYYFREDPKTVELRKQYVEHVGKMAALLGDTPEQAAATAAAILRLEMALAKGALDRVSRRDPSKVNHKMTTADLQALTPGFDWTRYLAGIAAPPIQALNVTEPDFFKAVDALAASAPLDDIKTYLRWQLVHRFARILPTAFVDENFRFNGTILTGTKALRPRWKRCVDATDGDLGEALGKSYVKEAFGPKAKADTLAMVHGLERALERDINGLTWMTEATKKQALVKLHGVANKIGYPDRWRDYSGLSVVRGDALGNSQRSNVFDFHFALGKIGKPVDHAEWGMTPPTVNAYYNSLENNINFPAGILQPPFFSPNADAAVNFGAAGGVIGHELTHGFDDQGRRFDAQGNLRDWWTPADSKAFEERAACFADEYGQFVAIDDVKLNGKLTLGENTADNGGLRIALMAYLASVAGAEPKTIDGFTPEQRVFLGWGQIWCENNRPEVERMLAQTNPHSPGRYRVNGVLSNMPEFQKAFSCKADAPMVRKDACRVW